MSAIAIHKNTRSRRYVLVASAVLVTLLGVTGASAGNAERSLKEGPPQPHHRWHQTGRASWYGRFFQGQQTASGEAYDMNALTCAHRTLPIGAFVRVTNLLNHKSVVVRVNDRGPVPQDRIVDLSYAAAHLLGFSKRGIAPVRLELLAQDPQMAQLHFPASVPERSGN